MTIQQAIATAVTTLSEAFRQPLTDVAARGYMIGLDDLTHEQVAMAMKRAIRESKFMPSPAELRAFAGAGGARATETVAVEAWEAVRSAMDRHDYTVSVDFGSLVNAVVRNLGGWAWLCDQRLSALPFVRKDFERVYALLAATQLESVRGEPLAGAFRGAPVRVPIGNALPPSRGALPEQRGPAADNVRKLVADLAERADYP
jgi:hypothetical protein